MHFDAVYPFDSKMLIKLFTNNIESSKSIFNIVVGKFISLYLLTHPYIKSRFCETFVLYMNQYFIIYKPYLVASQFSPIENKETLAHYFDVPKDVYPVGRLDADSEGLLILTSDTSLNHKLLHPDFAHQRTYYAQVDGAITKEAVGQLEAGVTIQVDGKPYLTKPARAAIFEIDPVVPPRNPPIRFRKEIPAPWIHLSLTEGKNRQVRKMTAAVGFPTLRLIRYSIGKLSIAGMQPGDIIEMGQKEIMYQIL